MHDTPELSINNLSVTGNGTALQNKIYSYNLPNNVSTKLTLSVLVVLIGIVGFVGNIIVLCFLKAEKKNTSFLKTYSFEKNFRVYVRSLAISDVLSSLISVPSIFVEINFDLFHTGWSCKIAKYIILVFPCITINNLLVINIERYLSTRPVPRTFRHPTVKRMVLFAWVVGCFNVLFAAATFRGVRFDVDKTHYTVVCRFDNHHLPSRIIYLRYAAVQFIIPMLIVTRINISLIRTVWTVSKRSRTIDVQRNNGIKMKARAATIRSTWIIIALTFAFVTPYVVYFAQVIYNHSTKATFDFKTDFMVRAVSGIITMANPAVNFVLYLVQLQDFRAFIKGKIVSWYTAIRPMPVGVDNVEIQLVKFSTVTHRKDERLATDNSRR